MTYHIFPVLTIKYLINKYGDPNTPFKIAIGRKPSVSHLRELFISCVVSKATAHIGTKELNMHRQAQNSFLCIYVGTQQHYKGILCTYQAQEI